MGGLISWGLRWGGMRDRIRREEAGEVVDVEEWQRD